MKIWLNLTDFKLVYVFDAKKEGGMSLSLRTPFNVCWYA